MPNLNTPPTISAALQIANVGPPAYTAFLNPALSLTSANLAETIVSLAAGFNAIAVPSGVPNGVIIQLPTTAGTGSPAIPFNLKGITGDTGLPMGLGTFQIILWKGATIPATIGITNNYSSTVSASLYFF